MEGLVPIGIYIVLGLVALSLLVIALFGIRSIAQGRVNVTMIGIGALAALVFVGIGASSGDWPRAGILTFIVMLGFAAVSLLLSGMRGLFS